jgi:hypothetical protein
MNHAMCRRRLLSNLLLVLFVACALPLSSCGRDETDTLPTTSSTSSTTSPTSSTVSKQPTARATTSPPKRKGGIATVRACISSWNRVNPGKQFVAGLAKTGRVYVAVVSNGKAALPSGPGDCRMVFAVAGNGPTGRAGAYTTDASGKWCCFDNSVTKVGDLMAAQRRWNAHSNSRGRVVLGAPRA